ncbi:secretin and TonB N-terminal domain-containing protein [Polynucleobacter sp. 80A-SIGWE]|uniref:secretin and TonB N-terminal domain-containing protein n=1 Tax=Polynucleobacter sp. 80A-SIGWE TaxID=2689100 RepID=UPI0021065C33|nr:secretin and TonB N-terminal domain-containing protein [Polynucleobacter sp. 80A-SIGWE]MBU3588861.1 secretin and TonB N-terminal domain-containing protein [Polynucleobacter sp. 80A-SIGWE]
MKILQKSHAALLASVVLFLINPASGNAPEGSSSTTLKDSRISLQFSQIEMTELLQVLAKMGNTNFLLSESIQGKISVDLKDTPWQTALHSILASRGLRLVRNGDIYWIGPHAEIQSFQKFRREDAALPFGGDHINSPRQILIEARIVEADQRFARELGMKLGYQANGIGNQPDQNASANLDLGGTGLAGFNPATLAATLVSKNAARLLQIELSALESDGQGKILSNPRIMTGDQVKATIEQGTELPYQVSSQSGSKLQFRKANLRLEVLPKIHPDGKISMLVGINKDTIGMKTEQGYAIDTKNLSSEVTVENGGTAIIGGIFQTTERDDEIKVPLLGDIPLIGHLFRHKSKLADKTELLVFLTPTVLDKH